MLGFYPVSFDALSSIPQDIIVVVPKGTLTLSSQNVSIALQFSVGVRTLTLTGRTPTLATGLPVGKGSLSFSGLAPSEAFAFSIPKGTLALTGNAPLIAKSIPVGKGSLTLTSLAPTVGKQIPVAAGSLTIAGKTVAVGVGIGVATRSLVITTYAPNAARSDSVSIDNGVLSITGQSPGMGISFGMGSAVTNLILSGHIPKLRFGKVDIPKVERDTQALISFGVLKSGATWIDVNSRYKQSNKPLLLTNVSAINNSLQNLFSCPIGSRGRIMQPRYGTFIYNLLQEPIDAITANKLRASLIQTIEEWEPRIQLDYSSTYVIPDSMRPGYKVQVKYTYIATGEPSVADFFISV